MAGPKVSNAPGPAVPLHKVDQGAMDVQAADGPRAIQARFIVFSLNAAVWHNAAVTAVPQHAYHSPLARWPQGAGKGKRVTVRSPEAAAQSGDALAVIGGGAQNTAEARVTSAQAPAEPEAIVKQEAGSGTAAGVRGCTPEPVPCTA